MTESNMDYFRRIAPDQTYILADSFDDRRRLVIQAKIYSAAFKEAISLALNKFNLCQKLQDPDATFRVLDLGCGEGLYIPILAEVFAEHGAKARLTLVGLDRDVNAIVTAEEYLSALGIYNAQVYVHDLTEPFDQLSSIDLTNPQNHFDLIVASVVLMHLRNAPQILEEIYQILKPGGAFYTKDMVWYRGMEYPSPTFTYLNNLSSNEMLKLIGDNFAEHHHEYLAAAGFEGVESFEDTYPVGGHTETGRRMLENFLLGQHAVRPMFIKLGLLSGEEYDQKLAQEFREISPELEGHITLVNTVARRPL
jgi:SAM-dependent methyltransferase